MHQSANSSRVGCLRELRGTRRRVDTVIACIARRVIVVHFLAL